LTYLTGLLKETTTFSGKVITSVIRGSAYPKYPIGGIYDGGIPGMLNSGRMPENYIPDF